MQLLADNALTTQLSVVLCVACTAVGRLHISTPVRQRCCALYPPDGAVPLQ